KLTFAFFSPLLNRDCTATLLCCQDIKKLTTVKTINPKLQNPFSNLSPVQMSFRAIIPAKINNPLRTIIGRVLLCVFVKQAENEPGQKEPVNSLNHKNRPISSNNYRRHCDCLVNSLISNNALAG